ncbi:MAG: glutamyl-tRNA reductase [Candidatus Omnitrophica bacterium]|nr:glutamyl-tRNA reductase [Candidatus Omnitrophota bacterium]
MKFVVVGVSHKKSSIELREKFNLSATEQELFLSELRQDPLVAEALIVSTCNRCEIYAYMVEAIPDRLVGRLCAIKDIAVSSRITENIYAFHGRDAVEHFMKVAAGLDSLVIGEKQILGQIRGAVELARKMNMMGRYLNILSNMTLRTGKKVRNETDISKGGSSVSWAAVQKADDLLHSLADKTVLLIGAGKMSSLAAGDFRRRGVSNIYVMNRTYENGVEFAKQFSAIPVSFWHIEKILKDIDVCICSAGAPHYLIDKNLIEQVMQTKQTPLLLMDISMPRNIDPACREVDNVRLVNLDELDQVVEDNINQRLDAVGRVEKMIAQKIEDFYMKLQKVELVEVFCRPPAR